MKLEKKMKNVGIRIVDVSKGKIGWCGCMDERGRVE